MHEVHSFTPATSCFGHLDFAVSLSMHAAASWPCMLPSILLHWNSMRLHHHLRRLEASSYPPHTLLVEAKPRAVNEESYSCYLLAPFSSALITLNSKLIPMQIKSMWYAMQTARVVFEKLYTRILLSLVLAAAITTPSMMISVVGYVWVFWSSINTDTFRRLLAARLLAACMNYFTVLRSQ